MLTKKIGVALVPIIYPGSPPIPGLEGKQGIPSPNRNISSNNRGGTNSDFVSKAPSIKANEGLRVSSLPTEEKDLEFSMDKLSFSVGELGIAVAPLLTGSVLGYMTADDENKLRNAVIGGIAGGMLGVGNVAASRHFLASDALRATGKILNPNEVVAIGQKAGVNFNDEGIKVLNKMVDTMKAPKGTAKTEQLLQYHDEFERLYGEANAEKILAAIAETLG